MARKRGHIGRRGRSWFVTVGVNGRQTFKSFADDAYGGKQRAKEAAELHLANTQAAIARHEYRPPDTHGRMLFADAAEGWHRHGTTEGGKRGPWKASTRRDYRSVLDAHLLDAFSGLYLDQVTAPAIKAWRRERTEAGMSRRNLAKLTAVLHAIFEHARDEHGFAHNPVKDVQRAPVSYEGRTEFFEVEEVWALIRAAADDQDGALYLTAAFTGLRMGELLALRWRDVDFPRQTIRVMESYAGGELSTPKSGHGRPAPLSDPVAAALDQLSQRRLFIGPDDLVFPGDRGSYLDGSALRRRYKAARKRAGLRELPFHSLRHTFGTVAADAAESPRQLQEWLGHADLKTTAKYLHYRSRGGEAARLTAAFQGDTLQVKLQANGHQAAAGRFHPEAPDREGILTAMRVSAEPAGMGEPV